MRIVFQPPHLVIAGLDQATHCASPYGMGGWVHIMASKPRGNLYTGAASDLVRRVYLHREGLLPGFTKRYGVKRLVYYERHATMPLAIQREKTIKHWSRQWKIDLIVSMNPEWRDLWEDITR